MRNELDLTDAEVADGLALARLMDDEKMWGAVLRVLAKVNDDAIARWDQDTEGTFSKKWLRGYREAAGAVMPAIEKRAQDARNFLDAKERDRQAGRTMSLDEGRGNGEMVVS